MCRSFLLSAWFLPNVSRLIRARVAVCCSFFVQGLVFATWCTRIPDIKIRLGLDEAQLGTLLLALPVGQLLAMAPNGWLVERLGSRRMLIFAGFSYSAILTILGCVQSISGLAVGLFFAGVMANLSNTAANTQGVILEGYYRRSIMALFHGMWSLAGLVAVVVGMILTHLGFSVLTHFIIIGLGIWFLLTFSGGALYGIERRSLHNGTGKHVLFGSWKITSLLCWLGVASLGCMACEGTIYDWSGVYMRDVLGVSQAYQSLGYFGYLCAMVSMRFVADRLVNRYGVMRVLFGCGLCISGGLFLVVGLSWTSELIARVGAVVGFAVVGCGTSAVVPVCCGLAGKDRHVAPSIAIAEVSTIGFFGFLAAPPLIGYIAHIFDLRVSFALMAMIGLLVLFAVLRLKRHFEFEK